VQRGRTIAIVLVLAALAGLGVAYALFFTPDTPEELAISETPASGEKDQGEAPRAGDPTGRWQVVSGSEAGYRVREKLARLPAPSDAVGRTRTVTGGLTVEARGQDYEIRDVEIQADVSQLESDSPRRDKALRTRGLETDRYPLATFVGREPLVIPQNAARGETVRMALEGMLTIHNVTKQVSIPVEARLNGDNAEVAGSFTFPMSEFDIQPPNVAGIVTVEPTGTMEFRVVLAKAA
jgi:polyisoprenoid-binding protein YceI